MKKFQDSQKLPFPSIRYHSLKTYPSWLWVFLCICYSKVSSITLFNRIFSICFCCLVSYLISSTYCLALSQSLSILFCFKLWESIESEFKFLLVASESSNEKIFINLSKNLLPIFSLLNGLSTFWFLF
jgi:hypothetical protein